MSGFLRALLMPGERRSLTGPGPITRADLVSLLAGRKTHAGVNVTDEKALTLSAVFACIRNISEDGGALPCQLFEREGEGKKRVGGPLARILGVEPNPEMTAPTFWSAMMAHVIAWGNAYAEKEESRDGTLLALWPLRPDRTWAERRGGVKKFKTQIRTRDGGLEEKTIPAWRMFHVPGFGFDGLQGKSILRLARESIGWSLAAKEFSARYFADGAHPSLVAVHPQTIGKSAMENLRHSIEGYTSGLDRAHRVLVLEEGIEVEKIGIPPGDSQFIETSNHQVEDIARFFRMPLHKIGHLLRATFSNIEQQDLDYYKSTLLPVLVRFEAAIRCSLIPEEAQDRFFAEFLVENVLRADIETRYKAYSTAVQNGIMTRNEARARENLDPDPSRGANALTVQLNLVPLELLYGSEDGDEPPDSARALVPGQVPAEGSPGGARTERNSTASADGRREAEGALAFEHRQQHHPATRFDDQARESRAIAQLVALRLRYRRSIRPVLERAFERLGAVEIRKAEREFKKALSQDDPLRVLRDVMAAFHEAEFPRVVERELAPVLASFAELVASAVEAEIGSQVEISERHIPDYIAFYVRRHAGASRKEIERLREKLGRASQDEQRAGLEEQLAKWREERPGQSTQGEMVRFEGATAITLYRAGGRTRKRWAEVGKSCPFCRAMDGKIVGLEEPFAGDGAVLRGERDREEVELQVNGARGHAPLHRACNCVIVSA